MSEEVEKKLIIKPSNLKDLLQANKEIGKLSNGVPILCAAACEEFVKELIKSSVNEDQTSVDLEKLIHVISTEKKYDFLLPFVPQFQEEVDKKKKK